MAKAKTQESKAPIATMKSKVVAEMFPQVQDENPEGRELKIIRNGRPTKYSPAILKKTYDYIEICRDQFFNYQKGFGATDTYERRVVADLPTLEGLSIYLGVHRDTVHDWSRKHPNFSDALEIISALQKERLIQRGLSNDYNPTIAKLILSANHGMKERSDVTSDDKPLPEVTINNFKSLSDDELIAIARRSRGGVSN